ncbi:ABC transporter permease [Asticcacaulis sp. BYS171W]|uniref:ABC transporter permease n=1 Tax=Asticcacaulis aquaticus TaxID=2984212 RepID=A0ABT5HXA0_9CAUL|nr:ABC transporter permease [Asticcacaulis aquaticus]MDC7684700.1 ABC transporter permease [Asticcacaulis aquaticus]
MKTLLIAKREYLAFVKTVGFWLSLVTLPLLMLGSAFIPVMMSRSGETPQTVAVLDLSGENLTAALTGFIQAQDPALKAVQMSDAVRNDSVARTVAASMAKKGGLKVAPLPEGLSPAMTRDAAATKIAQILSAENPPVTHVVVAYLTAEPTPRLAFDLWSVPKKKGRLEHRLGRDLDDLQFLYAARQQGIAPEVARSLQDTHADIRNLTPTIAAAPDDKDASFRETLKENGPRFAGVIMSYITWMAIFSSSVILLSGIIEEKSSKVLEVLLTSAPAGSLLLGKVLGVFMVMVTVAAVWSGVGMSVFAYGLAFMPADAVDNMRTLLGLIFAPHQVALMLAYFVGGYLMFGITFIAIGAFCESQKDAQAIMGPIVIVLMIPMLSLQAAMMSPDLPLIRYLSWFPLFTPFLMPLRLMEGAAWWEIAATLAGMGLMAWIMIRLGTRAFMQGALGTGKFSWRTLAALVK